MKLYLLTMRVKYKWVSRLLETSHDRSNNVYLTTDRNNRRHLHLGIRSVGSYPRTHALNLFDWLRSRGHTHTIISCSTYPSTHPLTLRIMSTYYNAQRLNLICRRTHPSLVCQTYCALKFITKSLSAAGGRTL